MSGTHDKPAEQTTDEALVERAWDLAEKAFRKASRGAIVDLPAHRLREFEKRELCRALALVRAEARNAR